ncbi:MAG: tRNA (adenosine(37)-N6)-threonylcarbamoyltransferase complex dimerization subunit type 1 TsaB [Sedimentisphaerales bacterium]|nr:tRNA (adenosine(37)-N6)-threonylcarbamoyltransferase complex dimerization subunit type 1 TsaB [Sedimentisphaerales bacterium]
MQKKPTEQPPLIVAVETSGRLGSVVLAKGLQQIDSAYFTGPMRHSAELFEAISHMLEKEDLKPQDIRHTYISSGPGSFTGIRIAVTMAKIMHFANGTQIAAVNTLDTIAANAASYCKDKRTTLNKIATILDAKREQFFVAVYQHEKHGWTKTTADCLMDAPEFVRRFGGSEPIWLLGEGLVYYAHLFAGEGINFIDKDYWAAKAEKVHQLGWQLACQNRFADPLTLVPFYLRGHEAVPKSKI